MLIDNGYFKKKNIIIDHIFNLENTQIALGAIAPYLSKIKGWE